VNLGTVKSRLTRGRSALRALLSTESVIPPAGSASYPLPETPKVTQ
jgi:RNA polymerase sigma-70 factor (ECF subfamily)